MRDTTDAEAEIPDIRAIAADRKAQQLQRRRQSHWLIRPFLAVYDWLNEYA